MPEEPPTKRSRPESPPSRLMSPPVPVLGNPDSFVRQISNSDVKDFSGAVKAVRLESMKALKREHREQFREHGDIVDANMPMDGEGRMYHLGVKYGEVANRIVTVGSASRAALISTFFDNASSIATIRSERGFTTHTGTVRGVPVSIVAIGMGFPNADFFIRECRCVVKGPMVVVRLGTCGGPRSEVAIGTVAVASSAALISRNVDAWQADNNDLKPYLISKPVCADAAISSGLEAALRGAATQLETEGVEGFPVVSGLNLSADSFYSSQGRLGTCFDDRNQDMLGTIMETYPSAVSLEMETFQLFHLAQCSFSSVKSAAAHMVIANRRANEFLPNDRLKRCERVIGAAVLSFVASIPIEGETEMNQEGCLWNTPWEAGVTVSKVT